MSGGFDPEKFMGQGPEEIVEQFPKLRKCDLVKLGRHLKLEIKSVMKKAVIQEIIVDYLEGEGIIEEGSLVSPEISLKMSEEKTKQYEIELQKIAVEEKLALEREKIAAEEREKEREMKLTLEREKIVAAEKERQERIAVEEKLALERERIAAEERQERIAAEERQERIALEREKIGLAHAREIAEMQFKSGQNISSVPLPNLFQGQPHFNVAQWFQTVPKFKESAVEDFFTSFEKMADRLKWPSEYWTTLLQHVLVGKGLEVYNQIGVVESANYEYVKEAILKAYERVPEAYRQKYRNYAKASNQTYVEFAHAKQRLFDQWCHSMKVDKNYENLRQIILIEDFKKNVSTNLKMFLDERSPKNLNEVASLADEYALIHRTHFSMLGSEAKGDRVSNSEQSSSVKQSVVSKSNVYKPLTSSSFSSVMCSYCKKKGHVMSECFRLKRKQQSSEIQTGTVGHVSSNRSAPVQVHTVSKDDTVSAIQDVGKPSSGSVMESFQPFIHDGFVSLSGDIAHATPVKVLRDTGASQSLILSDTLSFSDLSYSGTNVLIKGVDSSDFSSVPLHNIHLLTRLVSGPVTVGVRSSLPFEGIQFLLGNDLAGEKVVVNPVVTAKPCVDQVDDQVEQEIPDLYPACAVTRAMSKKSVDMSKKSPELDFELMNTFVGQALSGDPTVDLSDATVCDNDAFMKEDDHFVQSDFVRKQGDEYSDTSLLFQNAVTAEEAKLEPMCFYMKNGVLMRKWRPPSVDADEDWATQHQIVVPKSYRPEILSIAHETPLSGHLGVNKTYTKILKHFYWPKMKSDVAQFCRSCHTCQMVGKPNQTIPKARLQPIPAFEEPFSRVLVDCVGPLPKTRSGNEYMLTVMCASTRFPEAIPLRNIKAKTIVKALIKFFTMVGLPRSIQSDQGSNFMSGVFQQVMHELGVKQYKSSAYHPESQGALERFHQTLKNMIRLYCFDTEKDWDEGVHLLLFAVRESVQESLGFSPFELVFGHSVRGPLKLLKEKLLCDDSSLNLLQYVIDFKEKLQKVRDIATKNLKDTQDSMTTRYNQESIQRSFVPGDKVLVLLPVTGKPLQAKFHGPYLVEKKIGELNYLVRTPDRRKETQLCHVNMLKSYIERDKPNTDIHFVNLTYKDKPPDDDVQDVGTPVKLNNSEILQTMDSRLSYLEDTARTDLTNLLTEFSHLFPDVPTRTDQEHHDVDVGNASPMKQHPYRLSPEKQVYLREEVRYLLDNDFIEPSKSNWSSPCILVPKSDGSYRLCTDYRKVNTVTKTDTYPIPRIDDCIDKVGSSKIVSKFDLLKGFWQVPLTDRAKEISAFVTPDGLFQYKVMPFGMKNSPATFQRLINQVTSGLQGCEAYIDDVIIYSETWEEHVDIMRKFFERLSKAKLTVNLSKCEFGKATVTFLGHVVGQGHVKPIDAKVKAICEFPAPVGKRQLMRFLGMAGYYRKFCPNFSTIAEPLTHLLGKRVKFVWSADCENAFTRLKAILRSSPVLAAPDFRSPFKLAVDASDVAAGAVLLQEGEDG